MLTRRHESGAVSLFLVIFAMLLVTVVTLSFLRVMIQDQAAASINDLSHSAYDSAMAGTEDAKRELIYYRTLCSHGDARCTSVASAIDSSTCNIGLSDVVAVPGSGEIPVQQTQSSNDAQLNQAYTCVKMQLNTDDYLGSANANVSKIIPLTATAGFRSVTLQWYSPNDLGSTSKTVSLVADSAIQKLLYLPSSWAANRPSLMRAQLIQFGSTFKLSDFDSSNLDNSNVNTLFLYPTGTTGTARTVTGTLDFTRDVRKTAPSTPQGVQCTGDLSAGGYACSVTLNIPAAIGEAKASTTRTAYLRLTPLYNASHFRVTLNGDTAVQFKGVQPSIDATGRANDQYRRVESRVDLVSTNFAFPEAAIDVTGNLCKNFVVTDSPNDYSNSCTP